MLRVINRAFAVELTNPAQQQLVLKCSENHLDGLKHFLRFDNLGFVNLRSENAFLVTPHKVRTDKSVLESTHGKVLWELINGIIHLKPLGGFGDLEFTVTLEHMTQLLVTETNLRRWDDQCIGQMGINGKVVYFYTNLILENFITLTDRESFYLEYCHYEDEGWKLDTCFYTDELNKLLYGFEAQNFAAPLPGAPISRYLQSTMATFADVEDIKVKLGVV